MQSNTNKFQMAKRYAAMTLPLMITIVIAIFGITDTINSLRDSQAEAYSLSQKNKDFEDALRLSLETRRNFKDLDSAYAELLKAREPSPKDPTTPEEIKIAYEGLIADQRLMTKRLSAIESIVMESPEKSVALPILKKDMETLTERTKDYKESIRLEIDRLYSVLLWIAGLVASIIITLIGWIVSEIIGRRKTATAGD